MKRLLLLVGLAACTPPPPSVAPSGRCYSIEWRDSTWRPFIPRTVRLDQALDNRLRYHLLRPVSTADTTGWSSLVDAWWLAPNQDSLVLILNGVDSGHN